MSIMLALAAVAAVAAAQFPAAPSTIRLGEIRMHLFYEPTGRLSPDISPPRQFSAWNTVSGGGEAGQPARDLLIVVELRAEGEDFAHRPLRIVARDARGRLLGERRFTEVYTTETGRTSMPLWLRDVTCAGEIRVRATLGDRSLSESLTLNCGE
jgi:hypothetical protein